MGEEEVKVILWGRLGRIDPRPAAEDVIEGFARKRLPVEVGDVLADGAVLLGPVEHHLDVIDAVGLTEVLREVGTGIGDDGEGFHIGLLFLRILA